VCATVGSDVSSKEQLLDELRIDRGEVGPSRGGVGVGSTLIAAALALLVGVGGTWWIMRESAPELTLKTALVRANNASSSGNTVLDATGYVTARRQATVSSEVTGKVVEVLIEEGMTVAEGQLLARLDDSLLQAALRLSEAQLEAAERSVTEIRVSLNEARQNLVRSTELRARGLVSEQALENATAEVDGLVARLESADQSIVVAERTVAIQQQQLDDTLIRAPFTGVVVNKAAQPGEMISPVSAGGGFTRTGICTIVDMDSLEIEVDVNESYINRVRADQPVQATLNSYPDWQIPAEVITIIPAADRNRATVSVRIGLLTQDSRILPDMGVKVAFLTEAVPSEPAEKAALLVPSSAVFERDGRSVVYLVRDGSTQRRTVEVTERTATQVSVAAGLAAGDRIVIELDSALAQALDEATPFQLSEE